MAKFPKIQRMCPIKDSLAEYMDGDVCRLCTRQVHDLSAMSESQRTSFLESCSGEICVSYALPRSRIAAAAALSAAMLAMPVAAQEDLTDFGSTSSETGEICDDAVAVDDFYEFEIIVGGIKDLSNVEYVDDSDDLDIPELPVTYEEDA